MLLIGSFAFPTLNLEMHCFFVTHSTVAPVVGRHLTMEYLRSICLKMSKKDKQEQLGAPVQVPLR
jgi:hypothetical protein